MLKLVVSSLLLVTLMVQTGSGLKCYVCEQLLDPSCGATYNGTTLTDCGGILPNRACVTITESISGFTSRMCGISGQCALTIGATYCQTCTVDGCNGSIPS